MSRSPGVQVINGVAPHITPGKVLGVARPLAAVKHADVYLRGGYGIRQPLGPRLRHGVALAVRGVASGIVNRAHWWPPDTMRVINDSGAERHEHLGG